MKGGTMIITSNFFVLEPICRPAGWGITLNPVGCPQDNDSPNAQVFAFGKDLCFWPSCSSNKYQSGTSLLGWLVQEARRWRRKTVDRQVFIKTQQLRQWMNEWMNDVHCHQTNAYMVKDEVDSRKETYPCGIFVTKQEHQGEFWHWKHVRAADVAMWQTTTTSRLCDTDNGGTVQPQM